MVKLREGEIAAVSDTLVHDAAEWLDTVYAKGGGRQLPEEAMRCALLLAIVVELRRLAGCVSEVAEVIRPVK